MTTKTTPNKPASASHVSRVLAAAGMTRASKYSTWGYETDGFIVGSSKYPDPHVWIGFTRHYDWGRQDCEQAITILREAGYVVTANRNNGKGGTYHLEVTR